MQTGNEIRAKQTCSVESFPILTSETLDQSLAAEGVGTALGQLWPGFRIKKLQGSQDTRLSYAGELNIFKALSQSGYVRRKLWAFSHVSGVAVWLVSLLSGGVSLFFAPRAAPLFPSNPNTPNGGRGFDKY